MASLWPQHPSLRFYSYTISKEFLYLTTIGCASGRPREIEIWFTQLGDRYYVISYLFDRAHWVKNIKKNDRVRFRVGDRNFTGRARILDPAQDQDLCRAIQRLSNEKYDWSDGLVVELIPEGKS